MGKAALFHVQNIKNAYESAPCMLRWVVEAQSMWQRRNAKQSLYGFRLCYWNASTEPHTYWYGIMLQRPKKLDLLVQRADDSVVEMFVHDLQDFDICVHSSIQL